MNCIFGIFDVLGFKSFCENCEPQAAEKVLKIIDDFETEIPRLVWQHFDPDNQAPQDKKDMVTSRLRWLTFPIRFSWPCRWRRMTNPTR